MTVFPAGVGLAPIRPCELEIVTAETLTYDDAADRWTALAAAPEQHTEVAATSLGERIRVSGGRRPTRSERTARLLEQMELQLEEMEATATASSNASPSRGRSRWSHT
jgi:hypothetical protein